MKKSKKPADALCGIEYLMDLFDCSRATIGRYRKDQKIPEPDVLAVPGGSNKWKISAVQKAFNQMTGGASHA